jgi:AraC-like DNA-binding protein
VSFDVETRLSDSPFVESITKGHTVRAGTIMRPAENCWHMVLRKLRGETQIIMVGALTSAGELSYGEGADLLWIKLKLGTFMPQLPAKTLVDQETILPRATTHSFWLGDAAWQFPDFENADAFICKLVQNKFLMSDPMIREALQGEDSGLATRTIRHRFLQTTGLTQKHIKQFERAQQAAVLLQNGISILETVFTLGYYDQPHLTRALKHFLGFTPAQILRLPE